MQLRIVFTYIITLIFFKISLQAQTHVVNKNSLKINFKNFVGEEVLILDSVSYKNELNQKFNVTKFKYYIGNIKLVQKNGNVFKYPGYFLVDHEKLETNTIEIKNVPKGEYSSIHFTIGVDSLDNCSGAQSGALDPINGMFWTWNTGYIFMKLEGNADESKSTNSIFEYHIGGYKSPNNAIRNVSLSFINNISFPSTKIESLEIKTDVLEILKSPTTIDFSKLSSVTSTQNATTIADNYNNMFSILSK